MVKEKDEALHFSGWSKKSVIFPQVFLQMYLSFSLSLMSEFENPQKGKIQAISESKFQKLEIGLMKSQCVSLKDNLVVGTE